jgi:hypothetical protein
MHLTFSIKAFGFVGLQLIVPSLGPFGIMNYTEPDQSMKELRLYKTCAEAVY